MKTKAIISIIALAVTAGPISPGLTAASYQLIGNTASGFGGQPPQVIPSVILNLDLTTGAASLPRNTGINYLTGIAAHPTSGSLYGLTTFASFPANSLVSINQANGTFSTVGS